MARKELSPHQAKFYASELQRSYGSDHVGKIAGLLFDAQVEPKPHQIDAALFALQTPFLKGVILADEVGLGKTIEAGIVITQYWAERKRRILIIAPSSLRQQWQQELYEKFLIPSKILDAKSLAVDFGPNAQLPNEVFICSYEFAVRYEETLIRHWDLVIADEAHRLRNHWTGRVRVGEAVAHIVENSTKTVLLTATPLQNKLEELYGLVSIFDPTYFYSLEAFRERYVKNRESAMYDDLTDRVAQITKRTLRKDADKYIRFTKRLPLTIEFQPSAQELQLYDLVNAYLQREVLHAFTKSQRHLSSLIIRKRLGSSTYAVASTLENIAERLEREIESGIRRDGRGALLVDEDLTDEEVEAIEEVETFLERALTQEEAKEMRKEVDELRQYAVLARSIVHNQKALKLADALDLGFEKLAEIGAAKKAIIFTDSTKTQEYIASSLRASGRGEGLVLFNGSNNAPESVEIYKNWLVANKDSDLITGIPAVDRRKALVEYFRTSGSIMVATEAAAEGINLQFCSMVVNYDLPWNPQRVEQRIGRSHRYGQKHNVVVVNFSNKGNVAEQRILELLANKFHLFESVFGASDEVLGSIEDGLDFERIISDILTRCKTSKEIDSAFSQLEERYSSEISLEMANAKAKVFDNLDPHVQDRLKAYDAQSGEVLNRFERLLLALTQFELSEIAEFEGDGRNFSLASSPVDGAPPGRYFFKSQPLANAHQYRFASPLAQYVVQSAKNADTPEMELQFSLKDSHRVTTSVRELEGKSGTMVVKLLTFTMKANEEKFSESYMLAGALTNEGEWLDHEYVSDILDLSVVTTLSTNSPIDTEPFSRFLGDRTVEVEKEVKSRNARFYDQQEELLYRNSQDRKAESEALIRDYRQKEKECRRQARVTDDPMEQLRYKKEARTWSERADNEDDKARVNRTALRGEVDRVLKLIEESLAGSREVEDLFTIRWSISK